MPEVIETARGTLLPVQPLVGERSSTEIEPLVPVPHRTVTQRVPSPETIVPPTILHLYVFPWFSGTQYVISDPAQTDTAPVMTGLGALAAVTMTAVDVARQPALLVTMTEYVPGCRTTSLRVVMPFDQR